MKFKPFRDWSLFAKIYLLVCVMLVVTMGLYNLVDEALSERIIQQDVRRRSLDAARQVAQELARTGVVNDPVRSLFTFLGVLENNPFISRLDAYEAVDGEFRGVATTGKGGPPMLQAAMRDSLLAGQVSQTEVEVAGEPCLLTLLPVESEKHIVGALAMLISQRELGALRIVHGRVALFLSPVAAALVVLVTYFVLQRGLQRRLRRIITTMRDVRDGRLDVRVPDMGGDELGVIAASFNEMIASVHNAASESAQLRDQLDRFNRELQRRVDIASAELQTKYRELEKTNDELLSVQVRLSRAERLAVAGQVAAAFAHEIGSPLSAISTHLQLLLEDRQLPDEARERVLIVFQQIERVVGIVEQLLATSRPPEGRDSVDVTACLEQVLGLSRQNLAARKIEIRESIPPGLPRVLGNAQQLQQVFLNLINNAADAMKEGGILEIRAEVRGEPPDPSIRLHFSDTGAGIPAPNLAKIFQPFFTTKGTGKGSGLGLAISAEIVRRLGGKIEVASVEGQGATFTVRLPCQATRA